MAINIKIPQGEELKPRITVFGVGGAGCNAVNNMLRSQLEGCEFIAANTDAQALSLALAERQIQMGRSITQGLGAGARPEIGAAAAEESIDEIRDNLDGSHMVFVTAGMGGGTGTGAAPVVARAAKEKEILTIGVITKPFHFEGTTRMRVAEQGICELQDYVDTLIIIPNQNLFRLATEQTTFAEAFAMADNVLHSGVRGITDLMVMPGLINLDFADVRSVMDEMGKAMMGTGEAEGEGRSLKAAESAISNPLLDDVSMKGARGVLINITGGTDLTLFEVDEAANRIRDEVAPQANIIIGSTFNEKLSGRMRISIVATGIEVEENSERRAEHLRKPAIATQPNQGNHIRVKTANAFGKRDAFIAPRAVELGEKIDMARQSGETDVAQTVLAVEETPKKIGFFARLTGAKKAHRTTNPPPQEAEVNPTLPAQAQSGAKIVQSSQNLAAQSDRQENVLPKKQPELQTASLFSDRQEEDDLEIPAFLRNPATH